METPQNQISHDENMRRLESKMKNVEWSALPNPIDKTGEEAKRLGLPVPPKPAILRFSLTDTSTDIFQPWYEMVTDLDGSFVQFTDYSETAAERDVLKLKLRSADKEIDRLKLVNQMLDESEDCAHLREVNAELLAALKGLAEAERASSDRFDAAEIEALEGALQVAESAIAKASV